jgi:uncharacterized OB-fold protein
MIEQTVTEQRKLIWTIAKENLFKAILYWICPNCGHENHPLYTVCQDCKQPKFT